MMTELPGHLINSLTSLGLLESEAKVYAAMVVLKSAEVKDLLEFLDISKPSIYDALRVLEDSGLIVLTCPRPVTYQAIAPNIALEVLVDRHNSAKNEAIKQFKELENRNAPGKTPDPLWFIFGNKSFDFKIRDMLANAKESIYCLTSEKNLHYLEKIVSRQLKTKLILISDDASIRDRLLESHNRKNLTVSMINKAQLSESLRSSREAKEREDTEMTEMFDMDNYFVLIIDDAEAILLPPLKGDYANAISMANKVLVRSFRRSLENNYQDL